jgi:hypothetical protein
MKINQAKFTRVCNFKAIVLQLFDTVDVSNIPLRKVVFYQLKHCHILQGFNEELEIFSSASVSPLTTKHCDRYMLRVEPIIDLFMFLRQLPSNI